MGILGGIESMSDPITGLGCPRCGGIVPIPEGAVLVACPYCDQRSVVSAENTSMQKMQTAAEDFLDAVGFTQKQADQPAERLGIRRYQARQSVSRDQAIEVFRGFISGKFQVARDCAKEAKITEVFLVHLPFWAVWGKGMAYAFGQQQVGSGDNKRYEPREKKAVSEMTWNAPACEVGEFGVRQIMLDGCPLDPFNPVSLHSSGMVFEPIGSAQAAIHSARESFTKTVSSKVSMSRTEQLIVRLARPRLSIVYYPLWVIRYLYRGRSFQVVVDGVRGESLYGKAPGSVAYRAGVLVAGMAAGAILTVDVPAAIMLFAGSSSDEDSPFGFAVVVFLFGLGLLWSSYRIFRHAEHYEYHRFGKPGVEGGFIPKLTEGLPKDFIRTLR